MTASEWAAGLLTVAVGVVAVIKIVRTELAADGAPERPAVARAMTVALTAVLVLLACMLAAVMIAGLGH